jgi:hypothetical protein
VAAVPSGPNWSPPPTIPIKKKGGNEGRMGKRKTRQEDRKEERKKMREKQWNRKEKEGQEEK